MARGLFAAGFKKRREDVKHRIDPRAPPRPETTDSSAQSKNLMHITSRTPQWMLEEERTEELEQEIFKYKAEIFQSTLQGFFLCVCVSVFFHVSVPDVSA